MSETQNPLLGYFRKPEVFITLPSKGKYYPDGTIDIPQSGEVGIFPMTARDELLMKTPDALLNGSSTAEVIKSCVPAIIDPWSVPSLDMDALLVGIRIATYGPELDLTSTCPECQHVNDFAVELGGLLDETGKWYFTEELQIDDLTLTFSPLTYKEMNTESLRQFEESKIMRIVNDDGLDDEQKTELFQQAFVKLTVHTVELIAKTIKSISSPQGTTDNPEHIMEFIKNTSRGMFAKVQDHLEEQKKTNGFQEFKAVCTECSKEYTTPIMFDNSNFFA
jgi:hypothetical protein